MKTAYSIFVLLVTLSIQSSCQQKDRQRDQVNSISKAEIKDRKLETAYFASGCFWCVEAVFQSVNGVVDAVSGYAGGEIENPSYQQVSSGSTKHAEAVKVIYDPMKVDFETLLIVFFGSHDPTTLNRQGPDRGPQYRSIAFYENADEKKKIEQQIESLEKENVFNDPIVTEVKPLDKFWEAEAYHQEYESRNPNNPYVKSVSIPRLQRFKESYPQLLKDSHR